MTIFTKFTVWYNHRGLYWDRFPGRSERTVAELLHLLFKIILWEIGFIDGSYNRIVTFKTTQKLHQLMQFSFSNENTILHLLHLKSFISMWTLFTCLFRSVTEKDANSQILQEWFVIFKWTLFLWLLRFGPVENVAWHRSHGKPLICKWTSGARKLRK